MMSILATMGWALLAIFAMAVAVAAWEHLARQADMARRREASRSGFDADLRAGAPDGGDRAERAATLDRTLTRMTRPQALSGRHEPPWIETRPMIGPGAASRDAAAPAAPVAEVDVLIG